MSRAARVAILLTGLFITGVGARADTLREHHTDTLGTTFIFSLDSAPFPNGRARYKDDTVVVFVPASYVAPKDGHIDMAIFFHGHFGAALDTVEKKKLREQLVASRRQAWLIVPQLAENAHDSSAGKLEKPGGLDTMLKAIVAGVRGAPRDALAIASRPAGGAVPGTIIVAGHSGGFQGAAFAISVGGLPVAEVVLFDALYGYSARFARWLAEDKARRLVSFYRPGPTNRMVQRWTDNLRRALAFHKVPLDERLGGRYVPSEAQALFIQTTVPHPEVPSEGDVFADALRDSALRPVAPRG